MKQAAIYRFKKLTIIRVALTLIFFVAVLFYFLSLRPLYEVTFAIHIGKVNGDALVEKTVFFNAYNIEKIQKKILADNSIELSTPNKSILESTLFSVQLPKDAESVIFKIKSTDLVYAKRLATFLRSSIIRDLNLIERSSIDSMKESINLSESIISSNLSLKNSITHDIRFLRESAPSDFLLQKTLLFNLSLLNKENLELTKNVQNIKMGLLENRTYFSGSDGEVEVMLITTPFFKFKIFCLLLLIGITFNFALIVLFRAYKNNITE